MAVKFSGIVFALECMLNLGQHYLLYFALYNIKSKHAARNVWFDNAAFLWAFVQCIMCKQMQMGNLLVSLLSSENRFSFICSHNINMYLSFASPLFIQNCVIRHLAAHDMLRLVCAGKPCNDAWCRGPVVFSFVFIWATQYTQHFNNW